jgi:hypothetical protein
MDARTRLQGRRLVVRRRPPPRNGRPLSVLCRRFLLLFLIERMRLWMLSINAGVIYCLEPVFATWWSMAVDGEEMRLALAAGGAFILAALVIATFSQPQPPGEHRCA